jgi:hypothetical protein
MLINNLNKLGRSPTIPIIKLSMIISKGTVKIPFSNYSLLKE